MKVVIYCRKSTDRDDMQVQSIDTQLSWCLDYCKLNKYTVVETILEAKSAKQPWREWFNKMIMMFEKWTADIIITQHLDRLTRNAVDEWTLKWYAQCWKIKQIHCKEWIFTWDQVLMLSIHFWFSNQYIVDLRKKVMEWIETKIKWWWIVWPVPLWYVNNRITRWADVDDWNMHYIQRIFELRSDNVPLRKIVDILFEEGFRTRKWWKVTKTVMERMVKNPFYYWVIEYAGELYEWKHQALISRELWEKVNKISRGVTYIYDRDLSPLKWKVFHKESGKKLTVSLCKKKYVYFHLHWDLKQNLWYNQKEIVKVFDENLHLYRIPDEYKQEVKEWIKEYHLEEIEKTQKTRLGLEKRSKKLQNEKTSLIKMRSMGEISSEELNDSKNSIVNELMDINEELNKLDQKDDVLLTNLDNTVELLVELYDKRKSYSYEKKLRVINYMVVELVIDNNKRLWIVENQLFKALRKLNVHKWWDIRGSNPGPSP